MRVDDLQTHVPIRTLTFRETTLGSCGAAQGSEVGRSLAMSSHVIKVVIIESRVFVRDCLVRAIHARDMNVVGVASVVDALEESTNDEAALFLISVAGRQKIEQHRQDIARLLSETKARITVLEGKRPLKLLESCLCRRYWFRSNHKLTAEKLNEDLSIGVAFEHHAIPLKLLPRFNEILDDAIVYDPIGETKTDCGRYTSYRHRHKNLSKKMGLCYVCLFLCLNSSSKSALFAGTSRRPDYYSTQA
jgi:hypothetical protein